MNLIRCVRSTLSLLMLISALPALGSGDDAFLEARDAFRLGQQKKLQARLAELHGHDLEAYADYYEVRLRLESLSQKDINAFQERWPDSLVAERLRLDWVKQLGKRRLWEPLAKEYALLAQPDLEAQCYSLQGRLEAKDELASDQAAQIWRRDEELPTSCMSLMDGLVASKRLDSDEIWWRVRRMADRKQLGQARNAAALLKSNEAPDPKALQSALDNPQRYMDKLKANFAITRPGRELAMIALGRLARGDTQKAADWFDGRRDHFSSAERGYVLGLLAWQGAQHHLPKANAWYKAAEDTPLGEDQQAWKVRAALRAGDWKQVRTSIEAMPVMLASRPEWTYWLGRALLVQGRKEEGRAQFTKLAGQANFYGNLAEEELGHLIDVPPQVKPSEEDLAAAGRHAGLRRALALFRVGMRVEGVKEWSWNLRKADDRQLLAASALANAQGLYDRAISAADKTKGEHDFEMRYLAPYRNKVSPATKDLKLDESWVYGLMRQESRFVTDARSSVGATGLMQVMPKTAKWLAKKLGIKNFKTAAMGDMDTNVKLGTNYMKMVLQSLDNHPVLASAAYNAGPGRARKWRDERPLEGAIYVETIPFSETRDYVKKVMSNAVYYAALFEHKPQSLKARLGTISPRLPGPETEKEDDLP